ncbi:hypothetical protein KKA14_10050, partial [bacterium]|nr:hypothetical protein [bacterium]
MQKYDESLLPSNRFLRRRTLGGINAITDGSPLDRGRSLPKASPRSTTISIRETDIQTLLDGSVIKAGFFEFSKEVLLLTDTKDKHKLLNRLVKTRKDEPIDKLALELKGDIQKIMTYLQNPTSSGSEAEIVEKTLNLKHSITQVHKMPISLEVLVRRALFECLNGQLQLRTKLKGIRADHIDASFYESSKRVKHLFSALNYMVNAMFLGGISIEYLDLIIKINTMYLDEFSTAIKKANDQIKKDTSDKYGMEIRQELKVIGLFREVILEQAKIVANLINKVDGLLANPTQKIPKNIKEITIDLADMEQANENVQKGVGELVKGLTPKTVVAFTIRYARLFYRINGLRKFGDRILEPIASNTLYQRQYET